MGMQRGAFVGRQAPGPFHCLGCQTYVTGTASGHCPKCGWVPPSAARTHDPVARPSQRAWLLAAVLVVLAVAYVLVH